MSWKNCELKAICGGYNRYDITPNYRQRRTSQWWWLWRVNVMKECLYNDCENCTTISWGNCYNDARTLCTLFVISWSHSVHSKKQKYLRAYFQEHQPSLRMRFKNHDLRFYDEQLPHFFFFPLKNFFSVFNLTAFSFKYIKLL